MAACKVMKIRSKVWPGCFEMLAGSPAAGSHTRRAAQRLAPGKKLWAADRKQLVGGQPVGAQAWPMPAAIADRGIDVAVLEVDQGGRGGDADVDPRMGFLERRKPRQQPFRRPAPQGAHRQHTIVVLALPP